MIRPHAAAALSLICAVLFSLCFVDSRAFVSVHAQRIVEYDALPHLDAARKALKKGLYTEALKEAEEALTLAPTSAPALLLKADGDYIFARLTTF